MVQDSINNLFSVIAIIISLISIRYTRRMRKQSKRWTAKSKLYSEDIVLSSVKLRNLKTGEILNCKIRLNGSVWFFCFFEVDSNGHEKIKGTKPGLDFQTKIGLLNYFERSFEILYE